MGRILAIDYGNKRVGLAVTDPLCMIASPLETIHSQDLVAYVLAYHQREPLRAVVVGMPRTLLNEPTDVTSAVVGLLRRLRRELPEVPVHELDERFTSRMAHATMLAGGLGQKARRDKATVDRISAAIILQSFLESPTGHQLLAKSFSNDLFHCRHRRPRAENQSQEPGYRLARC
jgi:putative Holliday junction resolvase